MHINFNVKTKKSVLDRFIYSACSGLSFMLKKKLKITDL